jgi:hypothetical protein
MKKMRWLSALLLPVLILGGCRSSSSFDSRLNAVVSPYHFSIAKW